jgi:tetratricopeptide (TPR) repeat protein
MPTVRDFDLIIDRSESAYRVRVDSTSVGSLAPRPLELPAGIERLPRRRLDVFEWIKELQKPPYLAGGEPEELLEARKFGSALFRALFRDEVLASFRASRVALAPGERLRIRLRLPDTLTAVPWELLYDPDPAHQEWLALAPDIALVRHPEIPVPITPLRLNGPLQVVIVLASPEGHPRIDTERELRRVTHALQEAQQSGQVELSIITGTNTYGKLRNRLRQPVHILHVFCHGDTDPQTQEGLLIFEDEQGDPWPIRARTLRALLGQQRGHAQLVLLNACLGASATSSDPFSSVGAALVRAGAPAVIAMQFAVREDIAADLSRALYQALAVGVPLDRALWEARVLIFEQHRHRLDWAIPVLFLQGGEGQLFIPMSTSQASQKAAAPVLPAPPSLSDESDQARSNVAEAPHIESVPDTPLTLEQFIQKKRPKPASGDRVTSTSRAQILMQKARTAIYLGDYLRAATVLADVEDIDPNFTDLARLQDVCGTYLDMAQLRSNEDWQAVLDRISKLDSLFPGFAFADPKEHRTWAQTMQMQFEYYDSALAAYEQGRWDDAVDALVKYHQEFPSTEDSVALQQRALLRSEKWQEWKKSQEAESARLRLNGKDDEAKQIEHNLYRSFPNPPLLDLDEAYFAELDALSEDVPTTLPVDQNSVRSTGRSGRLVPRTRLDDDEYLAPRRPRARYSSRWGDQASVRRAPSSPLMQLAQVVLATLRGWWLYIFIVILTIAIVFLVWRQFV